MDIALSSPCHLKSGPMFTSSTLKAGIKRMDLSRKKYSDVCIVAKGSGCAASKYICERVAGPNRVSKLPASSFRLDQISGGSPRACLA